MRTLISVVVAVLLASPALTENLSVTIMTDPAGATLYANAAETLIGYTPVTLKYEVPKIFFKTGGCTTFQGVKVRWASGAEVALTSLQACARNGKKQQLVIARPTGVDGREIDALFALKLEELALMREKAQAAASAERQRRISEIFAQYAARQRELAAQARTVTCTSNLIGNTVFTNCY